MKVVNKTKMKKKKFIPPLKPKKRKPAFCKLCNGTRLKGHNNFCSEFLKVHDCINKEHNTNCKRVTIKLKTCTVCEAVWKKEIVIQSDEKNPHFQGIYREAVKEFFTLISDRNNQNLYSFGVKLVDQEYVHYDFGDRDYWLFTFKAVKK